MLSSDHATMRITPLASGSVGNSLLAEFDGYRLLIDAGLELSELEHRLETIGVRPDEVDAVFLTHRHRDHVHANDDDDDDDDEDDDDDDDDDGDDDDDDDQHQHRKRIGSAMADVLVAYADNLIATVLDSLEPGESCHRGDDDD